MKRGALLGLGLLAIFGTCNARADQPGYLLHDEYNHDPFADSAALSAWLAATWTDPRPNYYSLPITGGPAIWTWQVVHDGGYATSSGFPPFFHGTSMDVDGHLLNKLVVDAGNDVPLEATGNWLCSGYDVASFGPVAIMIQTNPGAASGLKQEGAFGLAATQANPESNPTALVADPIDLTTGDFVYDHKIIGVDAPFPMDFVLHSTSLFTYDYQALGRNAWHDFEVSFNRYGPTLIQLRFNRWRFASFRKNATSGLYESLSPSWNRWRVWESAPGVFSAYNPEDDTLYVFNEVGGKLVGLDRGGKSAALTYTGNNLLRVTDTNSGRYLEFGYTHPTQGRLITTVTDGARTATISYDASFAPQTITDAGGVVTNLTTAAGGQVTSIVGTGTMPLLSNGFDAIGRVSSQTDARGNASSFSYGNFVSGVSQRIHTNRVGAASKVNVNAQYRVKSNVSHMNNQTQFTYDSAGNMDSMRDPRTNLWEVTHDTMNDPVLTVDPLSQTTLFTYDGFGRKTSFTDQVSNVTTWTLNLAGQVASVTDPLSNVTAFDYDAGGMLEKITMPLGGEMTFTNTLGNVTAIEDEVGNTATFEYYSNSGWLKKAIDPAGKQTEFEYNGRGQPTKTTDHDGGLTLWTYDSRGQVATMTDAGGGTLSIVRDGNGNVTSGTNVLGKVSTNTYDNEDRLLKSTDPTGVFLNRGYDLDGRLKTVGVSGAGTVVFDYDANSNVSKITQPMGPFVNYTYDTRNLLTKEKDNMNFEWNYTYDPRGLLKTSKNPLNQTTNLDYDADGRLTMVTNPASLAASRTFDADGNVDSVTDPRAKTTQYTFDLAGQMTKERTHEGRETLFTYNSRGLPDTITDPMLQVTTMTYDNLGELNTLTDGVGAITFTRDPMSRPIAISEGASTLAYVRNVAGQITQYTDSNGYIIDYTYDDAGRIKTLTYGAKTVTYSYDAAGRLFQVKDWALRTMTHLYNASGQPTTITYPNAVLETHTYDARGLPLLTKYAKSGTTYWQQTLGYDGAKRITTDTIVTSSGTNARSFMYDTSGRLSWAGYPSAASWAVVTQDNSSNITHLGVGVTGTGAPLLTPGNLLMAYDGDNQVQSLNSNMMLHDANGNLTYGPLNSPATYWALSYDARNRLTAAGTTSYEYNAVNYRTKKTESGVAWTKYLWCPVTGQMLMSEDNTGLRKFYVYGSGLGWGVSVPTVGPETPEYYHSDVRGSIVAVTNQAGALLGKVSYGPWGEILAKDAGVTTPFLYCGRWGVMTDPNGLIYMRARYYSPILRQFITRDIFPGSIEDGRSLNRYLYAHGDPINYIDPSGNFPWQQVGGAFRMIGGICEIGIGLGVGIGSSATVLGAVVGIPAAIIIAAHGFDQIVAGWQEVATGKPTPSYLSMTLQTQYNFTPTMAEISDFGLGLVGSSGTSLAKGAFKFANIYAMEGASQFTRVKAFLMASAGGIAMDNASWVRLGGAKTSQIEKAVMMSKGIDAFNQPFIVPKMGAAATLYKYVELWDTGYTGLADVWLGAGAAFPAFYQAAFGAEPQLRTMCFPK